MLRLSFFFRITYRRGGLDPESARKGRGEWRVCEN